MFECILVSFVCQYIFLFTSLYKSEMCLQVNFVPVKLIIQNWLNLSKKLKEKRLYFKKMIFME